MEMITKIIAIIVAPSHIINKEIISSQIMHTIMIMTRIITGMD